MKKIIFFSFILAILFGCSGANDEARIKEVLATDPNFKPLLDKKEAIDREIAGVKGKSSEERRMLEAHAQAILEQVRSNQKRQEEKIRQLKAKLDDERNKIRFNLNAVRSGLEEKRRALRNVTNIIFNTKQLLENNKSQEERKRLELELARNSAISAKLEQEIKTLKDKSGLFSTELELLKQ